MVNLNLTHEEYFSLSMGVHRCDNLASIGLNFILTKYTRYSLSFRTSNVLNGYKFRILSLFAQPRVKRQSVELFLCLSHSSSESSINQAKTMCEFHRVSSS